MHRVFPSNYNIAASSRKIQFHRASIGDSRAVVTPFMQDGTYPPRNFATLGPSGLRPPFTGVWKISLRRFFFTLQHRAGVRFYTSYLNLAKSYVFIKQSLLSLFWCLKALFIPKLQSHFAEFLQYYLLLRLYIFY